MRSFRYAGKAWSSFIEFAIYEEMVVCHDHCGYTPSRVYIMFLISGSVQSKVSEKYPANLGQGHRAK